MNEERRFLAIAEFPKRGYRVAAPSERAGLACWAGQSMGKRQGRPRKSVPRTPSGQPSRAAGSRPEPKGLPPATVKRLIAIDAKRVEGAEYGTPVGRMVLEGGITTEQYLAARQWDRRSRLYWPAICAPAPDPQAARIGKARGTPPDPSSAAGKKQANRERNVVDSFREALAQVEILGPAYVRTVREVCEGSGRPTEGYADLMRLRAALTRLAVFWRLLEPATRQPSPAAVFEDVSA